MTTYGPISAGVQRRPPSGAAQCRGRSWGEGRVTEKFEEGEEEKRAHHRVARSILSPRRRAGSVKLYVAGGTATNRLKRWFGERGGSLHPDPVWITAGVICVAVYPGAIAVMRLGEINGGFRQSTSRRVVTCLSEDRSAEGPLSNNLLIFQPCTAANCVTICSLLLHASTTTANRLRPLLRVAPQILPAAELVGKRLARFWPSGYFSGRWPRRVARLRISRSVGID